VVSSLIIGAFYAVYIFAFMVWIAAFYWLYESLRGVIFDGGTLEVSAAGVALWDTVLRVLPTAVPLAIALTVVIVAVGLIGDLFSWFSLRRAPDANRDLSATETDYIDASAKKVIAYAQAKGYDRSALSVNMIALASVLSVIGIGAVIMFAGIEMLDPAPTHSSFPIELKHGGASAIVGFIAFICLGAVPLAILSRLSRSYSERAGWASVGKSEGFSLKGHLISFVRARRLSTAVPINPGEFLHAVNLSTERYLLVPAIALSAAALFLLHRDLNAFHTVTADRFEVVNYWTLAREHFSYSDTDRVEVRCFLSGKGEPVVYYELHFKNGQTLDLHKEKVFERQFEAYEAVDAKLVALGVPFVPGAHKGWFKRDERGYDPDCVEAVAKAFPETLRDRVRRFFHLNDMAAVEDIWPWDMELAQAKWAGGKYEVATAVALYTKAIESGRLSKPLLAFAHFGRAEARDDYEVARGIRDAEMILALRDYQKASDIEPTVRAYRSVGSAYIALGAYDEAKSAFRKALALDKPKPHWSLIGLARVERIQRNYGAAMVHLDELLRLWGDDDASMPIFYHRAYVLFLMNDFAGAATAISKGLAYQPDYPRAFHMRACARAQLGEFAKAKEDITETIKLATMFRTTSETWKRAPSTKVYFADLERDRATIDAMAAGAASAGEVASLCTNTWNYGEEQRTRSALLPAGG
jgi:tetratricopeptide (TPR) repeat protein